MPEKIFYRAVIVALIAFAFIAAYSPPTFALVKSSFISDLSKEEHENRIKELTEDINNKPNGIEDLEYQMYLADAYDSRGLNYTALERYKNAVSDITKALKIFEGLDEAAYIDNSYSKKEQCALTLAHRGEAYCYWGKYDEALADYNKAVKLDESTGYFYRGSFYYILGKYTNSIEDFTKSIQLSPPDNDIPYFYRGRAYYYSRNYERAVADFTKAIQLDPEVAGTDFFDKGSYYYYRGLCYKALGDNTRAQADFNKAKELGYNG